MPPSGRGLPHQYSVLELPDQGGLADVNSETSQKFRDYLASPSFGGLSVTIPHKLRVQPFLDELTDSARKIGAVNTITPAAGPGHVAHYSGRLQCA